MWLKKKDPSKEADAPEKVRYSRYYEHDGILRAYANRAMALAFLCIPTTLLALAFAVYVRLQPPTVIRVDENGQATVLGTRRPPISITQGARSEPTELLRMIVGLSEGGAAATASRTLRSTSMR